MIFVVPSELRENSNLKKHISDVDYTPLPGLEANTGADLMVSPDGLPLPRNDKLLQLHIDSGSKLVQKKFGHDLPLSITDGRFNEALSRMLSTGAMSWQCLLSFVGLLGCDENGMATINGQLTYGDSPMKWQRIRRNLQFWIERGGSIEFPLSSGRQIPEWLAGHQNHVNRFYHGENVKKLWPKAPVFYDEIEPTNPHLKEWKVAQKLVVVDDLRPLLCTIPGAKIGPERATAIFEYMEANNIRQDFMGFLELVRDEKVLEVPGIGKGILDAIRWGLFRTKKERDERKK
jgi:hypothetical protein